MKFSADINLTERSANAVASSLWNREDIVADLKLMLVRKNDRLWPNERWVGIRNKVMVHLRNLILPVQLKFNVENLVNLMSNQLFKWFLVPYVLCETSRDPPTTLRFYWTERGTLDSVRTAMFMIDHCTDKLVNFSLACFHCIEEIIYELWPDVRQSMSRRARNDVFPEPFPILFWVYYLNDDIETLMDLRKYGGNRNTYEFAFLNFQDRIYPNTSGYFLKFFSPERKKIMVRKALTKFFCADFFGHPQGNLLLFLFSHLEESEISQIMSENAYDVLASLLQWPCQQFFMPAVHSHWNDLTTLDYLNLFEDILKCVSLSYGAVYKNLAIEFWQTSPPPFREYVISQCVSDTFTSSLLHTKNAKEIIQMVFRDISPSDRLKMIWKMSSINLCKILVYKENWDSLKLFVQSCIPTRKHMEEFILYLEDDRKYLIAIEGKKLRTDIFIQKIREWFQENQHTV